MGILEEVLESNKEADRNLRIIATAVTVLLIEKGIVTEKEWSDCRARVTSRFDQIEAERQEEIKNRMGEENLFKDLFSAFLRSK